MRGATRRGIIGAAPADGPRRREIEQRVDVENRHDVAVAEQGRARKCLLIAQRSAQLLEHELLLFVHGLDEDAEAPFAPLRHDDGLARRRRRRRHLQHRRKRRQRNILAIHFGDRALLQLADVARANLKNAANGRGRQREQLLARLEQHDAQQRQRQRQVQRDARALVELGLHAHGAAEALDDALDDVHADAAAGDVGRRRARAEAGLEDQIEQLLGRPPIDFARAGHTPLDGHGAQHVRDRSRSRRLSA